MSRILPLRLPGLPPPSATRVPSVGREKTQSGSLPRIRHDPFGNLPRELARSSGERDLRDPETTTRMGRSPFVRPAVYFADDGASPGGNGRHGLYTLRGHIRIRTIRPARMGRMTRPPAQPGGILFSIPKDLGLEDMIRNKKHPGLRLDQLPGGIVSPSPHRNDDRRARPPTTAPVITPLLRDCPHDFFRGNPPPGLVVGASDEMVMIFPLV